MDVFAETAGRLTFNNELLLFCWCVHGSPHSSYNMVQFECLSSLLSKTMGMLSPCNLLAALSLCIQCGHCIYAIKHNWENAGTRSFPHIAEYI